ncbi:MAG: zinc-ribbon domain-containing protein, partial [Bryobacterales bacterium]|nr:zinc-ribbon domain-containing protein [Bryobacterales bacterium]
MPFCTSCGNQVADSSRFCPNCGNSIGSGAAGTEVTPPAFPPAYATVAEPLEYTIHGDNLQVARLKLQAGQEVYAEAGKMVYKTANISWETR